MSSEALQIHGCGPSMGAWDTNRGREHADHELIPALLSMLFAGNSIRASYNYTDLS